MYPEAYIKFLVYFHGPRDYFECHEILEDHWKGNTKEGRNSLWVGLIQVSVSQYHHRIRNFTGAYRTMDKAIQVFENKLSDLQQLGIDETPFLILLKQRLTAMQNNNPYESLNMPIADRKLLELCIDRCKQLGYTWQAPSDLSNTYLIYKHSLRDRSAIIAERKNKLKKDPS